MCELTHGMAGEQHGHGMLCVNPPLEWVLSTFEPRREEWRKLHNEFHFKGNVIHCANNMQERPNHI